MDIDITPLVDKAQDFSEFKVTVSNDEQKLVRKFPTYHEGIRISHDDPHLAQMVNQTLSELNGEAKDITVTVKYVW